MKIYQGRFRESDGSVTFPFPEDVMEKIKYRIIFTFNNRMHILLCENYEETRCGIQCVNVLTYEMVRKRMDDGKEGALKTKAYAFQYDDMRLGNVPYYATPFYQKEKEVEN